MDGWGLVMLVRKVAKHATTVRIILTTIMSNRLIIMLLIIRATIATSIASRG